MYNVILQYTILYYIILYYVILQYAPDLIFISAGFDAAKGDPLVGFTRLLFPHSFC